MIRKGLGFRVQVRACPGAENPTLIPAPADSHADMAAPYLHLFTAQIPVEERIPAVHLLCDKTE